MAVAASGQGSPIVGWGLGFRVQDLGFRDQGSGFTVYGLELVSRVYTLGFRVKG